MYFVRAHDLLEDLRRAQVEHRLDRRLRVYLAPKVLVIDEFGVWPCHRMAATALFALISDWADVLGDAVILDRLLHHSHVNVIDAIRNPADQNGA